MEGGGAHRDDARMSAAARPRPRPTRYSKTWSTDAIDSSRFKRPQDHGNPPKIGRRARDLCARRQARRLRARRGAPVPAAERRGAAGLERYRRDAEGEETQRQDIRWPRSMSGMTRPCRGSGICASPISWRRRGRSASSPRNPRRASRPIQTDGRRQARHAAARHHERAADVRGRRGGEHHPHLGAARRA